MNELEVYNQKVIAINLNAGDQEHQASQRLIQQRALWCAGISLEPVPFLDLAIILPLHIKMVWEIGEIYGFSLTKERAKEIALELAGTVALSYASRVASRSALKAIPILGMVLSTPMVYASTFALGAVAERYFRSRRPELPPLELKLNQTLLEQGQQLAKNIDWRELLRTVERTIKKKS